MKYSKLEFVGESYPMSLSPRQTANRWYQLVSGNENDLIYTREYQGDRVFHGIHLKTSLLEFELKEGRAFLH